MRVLVTGGAGFIGSHVVDALLIHGHEVCVLDNFSTGKLENITLPSGKVKCKYLFGGIDQDIWDTRKDVENFKADSVVHLAAQSAISSSIEDPVNDMQVNGIGTLNILRSALHCGVKRFVFSSTSAVYAESEMVLREKSYLGPNTPYGISKLAAEFYVQSMFSNATILRFGNVYGPRQVPLGENQLLSRMIRHFKYGDKFYIHGSGDQMRDFVYVEDVARAVVTALDGTKGIFNIASGEPHSVNGIATLVEKAYGVPGYKWEHTETEDPRQWVCMDIKGAKEFLTWEPQVDISEGVARTIGWWEQQNE